MLVSVDPYPFSKRDLNPDYKYHPKKLPPAGTEPATNRLKVETTVATDNNQRLVKSAMEGPAGN
jgi:hypothetical protein